MKREILEFQVLDIPWGPGSCECHSGLQRKETNPLNKQVASDPLPQSSDSEQCAAGPESAAAR